MATLRLFASLREAAGTSSVDIDATTVGAVLDEASGRFGDRFAAGLETAQVWLNGDPTDRDTTVAATDEIALIPPVSGGALAETVDAPTIDSVLSATILGVFALGLTLSSEVWVVLSVGAVLGWVWDVGETMRGRGAHVNFPAAMVGAAAGANAVWAWGFTGLAGAIAIAAIVPMAWTVLGAEHRNVANLSHTVTLSVVGTVASGSLVLVRLASIQQTRMLLLIAGLTGVGVWIATRQTSASSHVSTFDANTATLGAALLGGIASTFLTEGISIPSAALIAIMTALGMIAGRSVGSLIRTDRVLHTTTSPGRLTGLDSMTLGVASYWVATTWFL
ncbi:MAG: MoaD/ThiS family protein [Acidobacteria bacterium]|nr:MoaD/ThiS family protein [Acidobacteriota bacterium]